MFSFFFSYLSDWYHNTKHNWTFPERPLPKHEVRYIPHSLLTIPKDCLTHSEGGDADTDLTHSTHVVALDDFEKRFPPLLGYLRLVIISDTHDRHRYLRIPNGDVLLHAGDITRVGRLFSDRDQLWKYNDFNNWIGALPHKHKIVIGGNHDQYLETIGTEASRRLLSNVTYGEHEMVMISPGNSGSSSLGIYCSPFSVSSSKNRAFNIKSEGKEVEAVTQKMVVSSSADIVLSHQPVSRVGSRSPTCDALTSALRAATNNNGNHKPRLFIGGHYHMEYGVYRKPGVGALLVNACVLGSEYQVSRAPFVIDFPL
eukprot:PhM_4_TR8338/c0_g1_i1/m.73310